MTISGSIAIGMLKRIVMLLIMATVFPVWVSGTDHPYPYKFMLDDPLEFTGHAGAEVDAAALDSIPIGLFAPGAENDTVGRELFQGAILALEEANQLGGYAERPFRLVRRWDEHPWAAGSVEMVKLAYEDRVWAVIGHLDGTSNIAQQVAAKAYLPILAPIAADGSLTHARVPWIFRLPPDDLAQARALVQKGLARGRVGLVTTTGHDSRMTADNLRQAMAEQEITPLFHFPLPGVAPDWHAVAARIARFRPDHLVLHLTARQLQSLLATLAHSGVEGAVHLPWIPGLEPADLQAIYRGPLTMVAPFDLTVPTSLYQRFDESYRHRFQAAPTPTAAYAYDAAHLIIRAITRSGLHRGRIRDALADSSGLHGATGLIQWDSGGGNLAHPVVYTFNSP